MSDPTICVECSEPHTRRLENTYFVALTGGPDRADPYCSDECQHGVEVRRALNKGGRCHTCSLWAIAPIVPVHEFGTQYCSRECMPLHLRQRECEQ